MHLMSKLSDYLIRNGISQSDFAKMVGVGQPTISKFVRGEAGPSVSTAARISRCTGGEVPMECWDQTEAPPPAPESLP